MNPVIPDEDFVEAIKSSISIRAALIKLGLKSNGGGNYVRMYKVIERLKIDTSHFLGMGHLKGKVNHFSPKKDIQEYLKEDVYTNMGSLKRRLIKEGFLKYECNRCQISEWQGEKLSLHIDHINGKKQDNRIDNLRLLCPNCHSLTDSYCGRNKGKSR